MLGLAFKPNTDDMRVAAAIVVTEELVKRGAEVVAYDPIAIDNAKQILNHDVQYADSVEGAIKGAVAALTEWDEIKNMDLNLCKLMNNRGVIDGRNCFNLDDLKEYRIEHYSVVDLH